MVTAPETPPDQTSATLIVCADDFGLDVAVNEAVEQAHRGGILTCASLMVGEAACNDAVARARAMPGLGVGLHIALTSGRPVLPPDRVPDLVGPDGRFRNATAGTGARYFFSPSARKQLAAEIRAQFEAFHRTGLVLDHVNVHQHFHLHPTVASLIVKIGRDYGMRAVRVPLEPVSVLRQAAPDETIAPPLYQPWVLLLKRRLKRAGLSVNDAVFGLRWTGAMTPARVGAIVRHLPPGLSEIYVHPAVCETPVLTRAAAGYRYVAEFNALMDPDIRASIESRGIRLASCRSSGPRV